MFLHKQKRNKAEDQSPCLFPLRGIYLFPTDALVVAACRIADVSLRGRPQTGAAIRTLTGHEGKDKGLIYLYPTATLVVADFACSKPYPMDMPSRSLRRSSSPRKNVATLWLFRGLVCGKGGKAGCPVGNLSLRTIPQVAVAIRTPPETQRDKINHLSIPTRHPRRRGLRLLEAISYRYAFSFTPSLLLSAKKRRYALAFSRARLRKSGQCYRQLFVIEAWEA